MYRPNYFKVPVLRRLNSPVVLSSFSSKICFNFSTCISFLLHATNQPRYRYYGTLVQNYTIYALSSGHGKCGVSVIRVSGKETKSVVLKLTGRKTLPPPRKTFVSQLLHPESHIPLDRALVVWFAAPNSFTGEDVCEFQVHGGPAVVTAVLSALSSLNGLRPAQAGDYTKRAFLNDKMDLTEVEGLGDLIHAETEAQRRQALHQMEGSLSVMYAKWSKEILQCTAHMEAFLDFSEDEGLDINILKSFNETIKNVIVRISEHLSDKRGEILRNGVRIAIIGQPNVGKSSLLNAIIQRPAAIVSPIAGTTRDVIESTLDIDGFPILISDTAGLCDTSDLVEQEGIRRAYMKAEQSDLLIVMVSAEHLTNSNSLKLEIDKIKSDFNLKENTIIILNKVDLLETASNFDVPNVFPLSCKTMHGFGSFMDSFTKKVKLLCGEASLGEIPSVTQKRHRNHLSNCVNHLTNALLFMEKDVVISAEYMRLSLNEIGMISGKIGAEEILDVIFQDFCIGK